MGGCMTIDHADAELQKMRDTFDSKTVTSYEDWTFVQDTLKSPKLKLIFRASEYQFQAEAFHKTCDNIPHTLTVVKTEFGKIIAGYTPCLWDSPQQSKYIADSSGKSCLLSLDLREKMTLTRQNYSIRCLDRYGPYFGQSDLYISDKCNENRYSFSYFPDSYNRENKYESNQETLKNFSGSPKGGNFRVVEYEVFMVEW